MKFKPLADTLQEVTHAGALELIAKATEADLRRFNKTGFTGFHMVACLGLLNRLPVEMLTIENLTLKNPEGWTPTHDAAVRGNLSHIPIEVLKSICLTPDTKGQTPLFVAGTTRKFKEVPKEILSDFDLHMNESKGMSAIQGIVKGLERYNDKPYFYAGDWETVPKELLTLRNVTVTKPVNVRADDDPSLLSIAGETMHTYNSISELIPALSLVNISKMSVEEREGWLKAIEKLGSPTNLELKDLKVFLRADLARLETHGSWAEL